jgi:hypothetical protein
VPGSPHPNTGRQDTEAGPRVSSASREVGAGGQAVGAGIAARSAAADTPFANPRFSPAPKHPAAPAAPVPDLQYLDGSDPSLIARWSPADRREEARLQAIRQPLPPPADDFARIPFPLIAGGGSAGIAAAAREYQKQAKVVDTRLFRKVTLAEKGVSLTDFCAHLQEQTGVELRASRAAADEKVTVFVKEVRARDVMRAVARLFGFLWSRSGQEGAYRYELDQDLRSQLIEEERRNGDQAAAFLSLDAEMQKYRPFLDMSFDELEKRWDQVGEAEKREIWNKPDSSGKRQLSSLVEGGAWPGVHLYSRLTPRDRAALMSGQVLSFRPEAPGPDDSLPADLVHPILQTMREWINGRPTPLTEVSGFRLTQVDLWLNRSELGKLTLLSTASAESNQYEGAWRRFSDPSRELATGLGPCGEGPGNATANAALRGRSPFDQVVSLHPRPSCPVANGLRMVDLNPNIDVASFGLDLSQPYALSADAWEAIHQATGLPIVADFYTHLFPLGKLSVDQRSLFEALCTVGDALGTKWRKDGDFLLCRSTSYFWDKLKEVPNRYLQRWARDRDANSGLPLADFLEMAMMADQQLDSDPVAQGIEHYWGLPEWAWLSHHLSSALRENARCLALLTPDQLRRTLEPDGIPLRALTPTQQQRVMQLQYEKQQVEQRAWGPAEPFSPSQLAAAAIRAMYVPDGWYVAYETAPFSPSYVYGGRTPEEAKAAQRQFYHRAEPLEVRRAKDGYFSSDFYLVARRQ